MPLLPMYTMVLGELNERAKVISRAPGAVLARTLRGSGTFAGLISPGCKGVFETWGFGAKPKVLR